MEIIVAEQHHRGGKRYITLPSRRSDSANNGISILEIFEMLSVIFSEKAFEFYYRNRTQLAEIFYIITDTANRKQVVDIVIERTCGSCGHLDFLEHTLRESNLRIIPDFHV